MMKKPENRMNGMHHLIARWLAFTASARDRKRLHAWKDRDEANAAWVDKLGAWWNNPAPRPENPRAEAVRAQLSERLDDRISTGNPGLRRLLRAVAAVAVLALVSWGSLYIASLSGYFDTEKRVAVSTRAGQQSCVELPDGSLVWLNSESRVEFHADKQSRRASVVGEACFDVKPDKRHPFFVEAGSTRIRVVGTKFNVRHYAETGRIATSLLHGHVVMRVPGFDGEIDLLPGEKIVYNERDGTFTKSHLNTNNDILWQNGILIFDNEPFELMVRTLERYYDVEVIYDETDFENIHFTGSINNLSIYKVLEFINLTVPIRYTIENKTIHLGLNKELSRHH